MCGIAGIIGEGHDKQLVERMTDAISHRGPDDRGVWSGPGATLGHRRLTILDLSDAGHQPMHLGDTTIVYNGEIYNFRELRSELDGPFVSDCDTEVVLHLYARYGERCVEKLRGMFAFAIWDSRRKRLFAARDRLGIKPFFYRGTPAGLAFASELKALLEMDRPPLDPSALSDFFTYKYVPAPKTAYKGIAKLPPGHSLTWQDGALTTSRYWRPDSTEEITDADAALEAYESLVADAVTSHTLADVPVGVFLSGGLDSTTVVAQLDRPRTFTLGFDVKAHDESVAAAEIAAHFGAEHNPETARGGSLDTALDTLIGVYDEPFGDHSGWPVFLISSAAVAQVKVALSGEGGDELFAGYDWYRKFPSWSSNPWNRTMAGLLPPFFRGARSFQRHAATGIERYAMLQGLFTPRQKASLLTPELLPSDYDHLWFYRQHWRDELHPVKRLQWVDLHTYLPEDILTKADRASMAVSLEVRPPLLDHPLVEFALRLHPELMGDGTKGKLVMRRSLDGRVPPSTLQRAKSGFTSPIRRWVAQQPQLLRSAMDRLANAGVIRPFGRGRLTNEQVWSLLFLDRWLDRNGLGL